MNGPTVLGMNLLNFILSIFSAIGAVWTIIKGIQGLVPKAQCVGAMKMFLEVEKSWEKLVEQDERLSKRRHAELAAIVKSLDEEIRSLRWIVKPTWNILTLIRACFKSWQVEALADDVNKLRVTLLSLTTQDAHIKLVQKRTDKEGTFSNVEMLQERYRKMAGLFIDSFGDRKNRPLFEDIEANVTNNMTIGHVTRAREMMLEAVLPAPEQSQPPLGRRIHISQYRRSEI